MVGSNWWLVSGAKSATGFPLLAGDPHLPLPSPPVWHEIGLSVAVRGRRGGGNQRRRPPSQAPPTRTTTAGARCTASPSRIPSADRSRSRPAPASPTSPPSCPASRPTAATTPSTSPSTNRAPTRPRVHVRRRRQSPLHRRRHAARNPGEGGHRRRREQRADRPDVRNQLGLWLTNEAHPAFATSRAVAENAASTERFTPVR
jgi:hypothetical protein